MISRLIFAILVPGILSCSNAVYISRAGGYDLVIAVDESTPPPTNFGVGVQGVPKFLNNLQQVFTQFSNQLWLSTRKKFHINSVELLIPQNWATDATTATIQTYATADIKISNDFDAARVENPIPCGAAGQHIELPTDFFSEMDHVTPPKYGDPVRAILNLFARYRYGTNEEHGDIGTGQFPYFHVKPSVNPVWTVTGCSENLEGDILTRQGQSSPDCDPKSNDGPNSEKCRFIPSATNSVNTSLNFFPWANDVTEFCDETTHNHEAPNRHNLWCGHRSVWEVIRESDDYYQTVGRPLDDLPDMTFKVVKNSQKPLLYILLDKGRTSTSSEILDQIVQCLQAFVSDTNLPQDIVTAIGTFPQSSSDRSHFYVNEEGEWSTIQSGSAKFSNVIQTTLEHYDGPVVRDFGLAIQEVVEKIRARRHAAGSIVLVVKRGATQNGFEHSTYFGDVLSSIQDQNLRLFAIEIQQSQKTPYVNLEQLVSLTDGQHHVVNGTTDVKAKLDTFLNVVKKEFDNAVEPGINRKFTVFKGFVPLRSEIGIPILDANIKSLVLCLTIKKYISEGDVEIRQVEGPPISFETIRNDEWNEVSDGSRRTVMIARIENPPKDSKFDVHITNCSSQVSDDCVAFLVASVETADPENPSNSLDIQVDTSAENNYFDFDRRGAKIVPLSIFATIESGGKRVLNLENVEATIIFENLREYTIPLFDDGSGLPDVSANDGIYSSTFTPPQNGVYKISVSVYHQVALNQVSEGDEETVNLLGRLIPMDQSQFGCASSSNPRCRSAQIGGYLGRSENMLGTLLVENAITFSPRPVRILDFTVTRLQGSEVQFGFTSPKILGIDNARAEWYQIYLASSVDKFVGGIDNSLHIVSEEGVLPGTVVNVKYDFRDYNESRAFFAVVATFRTQTSEPSNVAGIALREEYETTTTIITTPINTPAPSTTPEAITPTKKPWVKTPAGIGTIVGIVVLAVILVVGIFQCIRTRKPSEGRTIFA